MYTGFKACFHRNHNVIRCYKISWFAIAMKSEYPHIGMAYTSTEPLLSSKDLYKSHIATSGYMHMAGKIGE